MSDFAFLDQLLQRMVEQDISITFRKVSELSEGQFPHASTLTRRPDRREFVETAMRRQLAVREVATKFSKSSPAKLADRLASAEAEVRELKRQRDLLVAGHRAAILAIGRIGGMKAWREHFAGYSEAISKLQDLGALPPAEIVPHPTTEESAD